MPMTAMADRQQGDRNDWLTGRERFLDLGVIDIRLSHLQGSMIPPVQDCPPWFLGPSE